MSQKETESYLEDRRAKILDAMAEKEYALALKIVEEMREKGFHDESIAIWDELEPEDRDSYLTWHNAQCWGKEE